MGRTAHSVAGRNYYPAYAPGGNLNWLIFYTMFNGQRQENTIDCDRPRDSRDRKICEQARKERW